MPNPTSLASLYERLVNRPGVIRDLIKTPSDIDGLRIHQNMLINNLLMDIDNETNPEYRRVLQSHLRREEANLINLPPNYTPRDFYSEWDEIDNETDPDKLRKFRSLIIFLYPNRSQIFITLIHTRDNKDFILACRERLRELLINQLRRYDIIPVFGDNTRDFIPPDMPARPADRTPEQDRYMFNLSRYRDPNIQRRYPDV